MINGIKDFIEDWKRKKSDDEENKRFCYIFDSLTTTFEKKLWKDLRKGDIVKVHENEYFPADISLINTSEKNGVCYIETKNLDGETNLKFKQANNLLVNLSSAIGNLSHFKGTIITKQPNEFIYEFDAKLDLIINKEKINTELDKNSFLLRGCSLKQTKYVYGFVIYVGHNTKIMKNSPKARTKLSRIESIMNMQIILIFCLQTILSIIGAIFYLIWLNRYFFDLNLYIFPNQNNLIEKNLLFFFFRVGTWTLIFTNFVPISLLVTLEMIKYIQGIFISWDFEIYDQENCVGTKVQTSTLNEELGQVKVIIFFNFLLFKFIFSDKTGTLTKNYMEFRKMSIGNKTYGENYGK